jgi:hypothetical protein
MSGLRGGSKQVKTGISMVDTSHVFLSIRQCSRQARYFWFRSLSAAHHVAGVKASTHLLTLTGVHVGEICINRSIENGD